MNSGTYKAFEHRRNATHAKDATLAEVVGPQVLLVYLSEALSVSKRHPSATHLAAN